MTKKDLIIVRLNDCDLFKFNPSDPRLKPYIRHPHIDELLAIGYRILSSSIIRYDVDDVHHIFHLYKEEK